MSTQIVRISLLILLLILFVSSPSLLPLREGLSVDMQVGTNKANISAVQARLDELEKKMVSMGETLQELASGGMDFGEAPPDAL